MRAWLGEAGGSLESLRLGEVPSPEPATDEVLVRVRAASLNPADLAVLGGSFVARFVHARNDPLIPGFDLSGTVVGTGQNVQDFSEGDEVFGFLPYSRRTVRGTLADRVTLRLSEIRRKPANVSHVEAACSATVGTTAVNALRRSGQLAPGKRILVNGASGGVGSFAVQIAASKGCEVWATCSAANVAFVGRLGAHHVYDYAESDPLLDGPRYHAVIDVANVLSYGKVERRLRSGGAYLAMLPSTRFVRGVLSSLMSSRSCRLARASHAPEDFDELIRLLSMRRVKAQVHASYSMEDVPAALRMLRDGSVRGKLAVVVSDY